MLLSGAGGHFSGSCRSLAGFFIFLLKPFGTAAISDFLTMEWTTASASAWGSVNLSDTYKENPRSRAIRAASC